MIVSLYVTVAWRVAQVGRHFVKDVQVHVKLMTPVMYLSEVQGPFEEGVFLLSGISPKCTVDDVIQFFSTPDVDSEVQQVIFTQQPGVAMLEFDYPPPGNGCLYITSRNTLYLSRFR